MAAQDFHRPIYDPTNPNESIALLVGQCLAQIQALRSDHSELRRELKEDMTDLKADIAGLDGRMDAAENVTKPLAARQEAEKESRGRWHQAVTDKLLMAAFIPVNTGLTVLVMQVSSKLHL